MWESWLCKWASSLQGMAAAPKSSSSWAELYAEMICTYPWLTAIQRIIARTQARQAKEGLWAFQTNYSSPLIVFPSQPSCCKDVTPYDYHIGKISSSVNLQRSRQRHALIHSTLFDIIAWPRNVKSMKRPRPYKRPWSLAHLSPPRWGSRALPCNFISTPNSKSSVQAADPRSAKLSATSQSHVRGDLGHGKIARLMSI